MGSGRSLGRSVQVKIANFETTQTVASSGTQIKGTYNFDYAAPEIIEEAKAYPHPAGEVQVLVPLQGVHHGGHQAAHVDLQEGSHQTSLTGGGGSSQVDEPR